MDSEIILSENKIKELKEELKAMEGTLRQEQKANLHIVFESRREAAADESAIKAKEHRVNEIKIILQKARVLKEGEIDVKTGIGRTIEVTLPTGEKKIVKIVHPFESDPNKNLVSVDSPIAIEHLKK